MALYSLDKVSLALPRIPYNTVPLSHPKFGNNIFVYEVCDFFHFVQFEKFENGHKLNEIASISVQNLNVTCDYGSGNVKFTATKNGFIALAHNTQCIIAEFDLEQKSTVFKTFLLSFIC